MVPFLWAAASLLLSITVVKGLGCFLRDAVHRLDVGRSVVMGYMTGLRYSRILRKWDGIRGRAVYAP